MEGVVHAAAAAAARGASPAPPTPGLSPLPVLGLVGLGGLTPEEARQMFLESVMGLFLPEEMRSSSSNPTTTSTGGAGGSGGNGGGGSGGDTQMRTTSDSPRHQSQPSPSAAATAAAAPPPTGAAAALPPGVDECVAAAAAGLQQAAAARTEVAKALDLAGFADMVTNFQAHAGLALRTMAMAEEQQQRERERQEQAAAGGGAAGADAGGGAAGWAASLLDDDDDARDAIGFGAADGDDDDGFSDDDDFDGDEDGGGGGRRRRASTAGRQQPRLDAAAARRAVEDLARSYVATATALSRSANASLLAAIQDYDLSAKRPDPSLGEPRAVAERARRAARAARLTPAQRRAVADAYLHYTRATDEALVEWRRAGMELAAADGLLHSDGGAADVSAAAAHDRPAIAGLPTFPPSSQTAPAPPAHASSSSSVVDRDALVNRVERAMARCQVVRAVLAAMLYRVFTPVQLVAMNLESHPAAFRPVAVACVVYEAEERRKGGGSSAGGGLE